MICLYETNETVDTIYTYVGHCPFIFLRLIGQNIENRHKLVNMMMRWRSVRELAVSIGITQSNQTRETYEDEVSINLYLTIH